MSDESLEQIERQIAAMQLPVSPAGLRGAVLGDAQRELRAARWDRRLARASVVLLVVGVGMNAALAMRSEKSKSVPVRLARAQRRESRPSVIETAIVVAEATDAPTARLFARQQAAMSGRPLTDDEAAAIEAAMRRPTSRSTLGNKG
jgi:hypothetical protein